MKIKTGVFRRPYFPQYRAGILLAGALFLLASCDKIEDPSARLDFTFSMTGHEVAWDAAEKETNTGFSLESGTLVLENIEFDGRREQGATDVYFISDFASPMVISLDQNPGEAVFTFDIPQGVYHMIEITLHIGTQQLPALVMEGSFRRAASGPVPIRYEYAPKDQIRIRANPAKGTKNIVFTRDTDSRASIMIDTESLMQLINYGMVVYAQVSQVEGEDVLLIDTQKNPGIYNSISSRLKTAFILEID